MSMIELYSKGLGKVYYTGCILEGYNSSVSESSFRIVGGEVNGCCPYRSVIEILVHSALDILRRVCGQR